MQLADMEEGLYNRKSIKRLEHKTNCCTRYIPYLRLIFLLEIMLFFGWGCYMILRTYRPEEMKNEARSIIPERYPPMIDSLSDIQKSHPEMPATFVKPEVIIDKINNLLENMKSVNDQNLMRKKASATNVPRVVRTNIQNSNNVRSNNVMEISATNKLLVTLSPGSSMHDKMFTKNSETQRFSSLQYVDKNVNADKNENPQFLEKLRNINKMKATNDLETFESRNDFTENLNHWTLKSQENHALDASNKLENLELNIATITNPENFEDHMINVDLINLQDPKQEFSDLTKDAAQNEHNENSFLFEKSNEPVKAHLELGLIICPPYESRELSGIVKDFAKNPSSYQPILLQEISEQTENGSSDETNEDKHDINDNDMSISAFGNVQDHFNISAQSIEGQHSSESIAKIKEDGKYGSTENIKNSWFLQPAVKDSVESSTPDIDKFQWFNAPPTFMDPGLGDISKSSEHSLLLQDTENMDIDDIIPGSQCVITIKMDILEVKCPAIKFDEEWNVTSATPSTDDPKAATFDDIMEIYLYTMCAEDANETLEIEDILNSGREVKVSPDSMLKMINAMELRESTASATNDEFIWMDLSDVASIDPLDSEEFKHDYPSYDPSFYDYPFYDSPLYDSNEEEVKHVTTSSPISESDSNTNLYEGQNPSSDISDTQQRERLKKVSKRQDNSASDNTETSLKDFEHFYALEEKLISLFKKEMSSIMTQYLPKKVYESIGDYRNNICNILRYTHSISERLWREQYVALSKLLEYILNPDYPHNTDDSYYRKKRMADDLTWQQGMSTIIYYI